MKKPDTKRQITQFRFREVPRAGKFLETENGMISRGLGAEMEKNHCFAGTEFQSGEMEKISRRKVDREAQLEHRQPLTLVLRKG